MYLYGKHGDKYPHLSEGVAITYSKNRYYDIINITELSQSLLDLPLYLICVDRPSGSRNIFHTYKTSLLNSVGAWVPEWRGSNFSKGGVSGVGSKNFGVCQKNSVGP